MKNASSQDLRASPHERAVEAMKMHSMTTGAPYRETRARDFRIHGEKHEDVRIAGLFFEEEQGFGIFVLIMPEAKDGDSRSYGALLGSAKSEAVRPQDRQDGGPLSQEEQAKIMDPIGERAARRCRDLQKLIGFELLENEGAEPEALAAAVAIMTSKNGGPRTKA